MLTTDERHELQSYSVQPGKKTWREVTLELMTLYTFINYVYKERRHWLGQTLILWQPEDVLNFCRDVTNDKSRKIVDIWLMEPLLQGPIQTWRWTTVLEIKKYVEEPYPAIPVYVTDAGQTVGLTTEEAQRDMQIIYTRRKK